MSDFDPIALYFIAQATLGAWFWPLVVLMILLVLGTLSGWRALRRAQRSAKRPLVASVMVWLIATIAVTLALPWWTGAAVSSYNSVLDVFLAVILAAAISFTLAMLVFSLAARKCAASGTTN